MQRLKILVTGSHGLIGSHLIVLLKSKGHDVRALSRSHFDEIELEGFDAIIHLCGKNLDTRWAASAKKEIFESRVQSTENLVDAIKSLKNPPKTFLCASAVGIYSEPSFIANLCRAWENAASKLNAINIRVVHLRFGMVLSSEQGAFKKILKLFRWCLGGVLGSGDQYMSWITIDDAVGAIYHILTHSELAGAVNIVSPGPITNREFSLLLAKSLHRPLGPPIPAFLLRLIKGEMADELLLRSVNVQPTELLMSGYQFQYPTLQKAFQHLL